MPGRLAKLWIGTFVLLVLLGTLWALSAPLGTGPDEGEHAIKAAAAARGELIGTPDPRLGPEFVTFPVPAIYGEVNSLPDCYRIHPPRPAGCAPSLSRSSTSVSTPTYVGRYPPLYYLLVGWPTLLAGGATSVYLMRLLSVVASATLIALAVALALLYAGDTALIGGMFLAIMPSFTYLSAVIEPNGFEASAAFCLWTALALLLVLPADDPPPRSLLHAAGVSATVLVLIRGLSLAWLISILFFMLVVALPGERLRALARSTVVRGWAVVIGVASAFALVWVVTQNALAVVPLGERQLTAVRAFVVMLDRSRHYLVDMFGGFNPRGTLVPGALEVVFWPALAALVAWAFVRASWRVRIALVLIAAATVFTGPVLTSATIHTDGIIWRGRYILPVAIGLPVLAGAAIAGTGARQRAAAHANSASRRSVTAVLLVAVALVCQLVGLYWMLRRFAVGTHGRIDILFTHLDWQPPLGVTPLVLASVIIAAALIGWVFVVIPRLRR